MEISLQLDPSDSRRVTIDADAVGCFVAVVKDSRYSFEVYDEQKQIVLTSTPWKQSLWSSFLGCGEHRISTGTEIISTVRYHVPFGFYRSAIFAESRCIFPRGPHFSMLGMEWRYDNRTLSIAKVKEELAMPIIGLAAYWLIRQVAREKK